MWRQVHKQEDEDYDGAQESLSRIIASREALVPPISESFHPSAEPTLLSLRACKVTPFSSAVGRLTLSSQAVYFQPFVNSPDPGEGESSQRQPWPVRFRLILVCFRLILVHFRLTLVYSFGSDAPLLPPAALHIPWSGRPHNRPALWLRALLCTTEVPAGANFDCFWGLLWRDLGLCLGLTLDFGVC